MSNKRKFRFFDNNTIFHSLQRAVQIKYKIEENCIKLHVSPEQLEMSMLPSDVLYDLVACYEAMYKKLLDEELLQSGYVKSNTTYH